jgi:NTE family protein
MLLDILKESYALSLSPGFFQFYAEMGILHALEETKALKVTHVSGASAGALVGGFLASGVKPSKMKKMVFSISREDVWDVGIGFGLLKGQFFQNKLEEFLPIKTFDQCKIPLGVTAYDVYRFRTNCIEKGDLATAIRASCCFPVLFAPVMIDSYPHIDGGVHDAVGTFFSVITIIVTITIIIIITSIIITTIIIITIIIIIICLLLD